MADFKAKSSISNGAPPQTPLGEFIQQSRRPLAVFKAAYFDGKGVRTGRGEKGKEGEGKGFAGPMSNCFLRA